MPDEETIELAAKTAHEVNRAYCQGLGDHSQPAWEDAPEWQQSSARNGIRGVIAGNGPKQIHENWLKEKTEEGWKYGPLKNPETKEHPCFVPYEQLPDAQKFKDALFINTVRGVLGMPTMPHAIVFTHDGTSRSIRSMRRAVKAAVKLVKDHSVFSTATDKAAITFGMAHAIFDAANPIASGDPR